MFIDEKATEATIVFSTKTILVKLKRFPTTFSGSLSVRKFGSSEEDEKKKTTPWIFAHSVTRARSQKIFLELVYPV